MVQSLGCWGVERMADKPPYAGYVKNTHKDPIIRAIGGWYHEAAAKKGHIHFAFKVLPESETAYIEGYGTDGKMTSSGHHDRDSWAANDPQLVRQLTAMIDEMRNPTGELKRPQDAKTLAALKKIGYSSGYRTFQYVKTRTKNTEWRSRAPAGGSEHHTGYAFDIPDTNRTQENITIHWKNITVVAPKYGFVRTFTTASGNINGVITEPWHYKWLGSAKARQMLTPIDGSLAAYLVLSYGNLDYAIQETKRVKTLDTGTLYEALKNDFEALKAGKTVTGSGVAGTSTGSTPSDTTGDGGSSTGAPSTSTTARKPTNTGAPSVCKNLAVDPRVKEAFELAFKALYPDGKVDFGPVPTSQPPLGQNIPSPAGPGNPNYQQVPPAKEDSDKSGTESTSNIPVAG